MHPYRLSSFFRNSIPAAEDSAAVCLFREARILFSKLDFSKVHFSSEFFFNADDYSGEREETFFVYDLNINLLNLRNNRYSLIYEFKVVDQLTEKNKNLDTISALTFRSKNEIDFGISILMPNSGEIEEYINSGIAADLIFKFN